MPSDTFIAREEKSVFGLKASKSPAVLTPNSLVRG